MRSIFYVKKRWKDILRRIKDEYLLRSNMFKFWLISIHALQDSISQVHNIHVLLTNNQKKNQENRDLILVCIGRKK